MNSEEKEMIELECSEADKNYLNLLLDLLQTNLTKDKLATEMVNLINDYEKKSVNGLIRDIVSDIECHLGIYKNKIRDVVPQNEFNYEAGINHYIDLLNRILTEKKITIPTKIYETYIRWLYYENQKIEVEVLFIDDWNFILYKSKQALDFYISILFSQSFASWSADFKIEGEQKQIILSMLDDGEISKATLLKVVAHYKAEYYKSKQ